MRSHRNRSPVGFTAAFSQIADEFLARVELGTRWPVAIKIADQTNAQRDVVKIVAVHMATIDLAPPAIADFDLAVSGGCSVSDYKMIGQPILHPAHMSVVIIEHARIPLPCTAIVHHNKLPPTSLHRRASDRFDDGPGQITIVT